MAIPFSLKSLLTSCSTDAALGGGYPKGRVVEIYGPESSGKTTLALHAIAECQKVGGTAAFVDAEHALDPQYAANMGVDIDAVWETVVKDIPELRIAIISVLFANLEVNHITDKNRNIGNSMLAK